MDPLTLKRGGLRSSFTKTVNALILELGKDEILEGVIEDKFVKLQRVNKDLEELNEQILNFIISSGAAQKDITEEMEGWETYSDQFITVARLVNKKLPAPEASNSDLRSHSDTIISVNKIKPYKLPKIELKKFDGELLNWLPFWSQFEKINDDPDLHDSDKFQYLVQCMQPGSRAKDFIDSYPMTSQNYTKAISALKERFGKSDLLVEVYVRELIKLIITNVKVDNRDKLQLPQLFDKIEAQLRALESLGIKTDKNSCWLYPMVESSLTEEVMRAWQRSSLLCAGEEVKDASRLTNLMKFLKSEVEGEERLKLARSGFETLEYRGRYRDKPKGEFKNKFQPKKVANIPTASGFFASKDRSCIFCNKPHESKDCYEARSLSLPEKIDKIKEKRCCLRCLAPGHLAKLCKQFIRCYACGKAHVISLCPQMHPKGESPLEKQSTEMVQAKTTASQTCTTDVALMTLEVKVVGKTGTRNLRALLDCGSQNSYILKSTAKELGLTPISKETVVHTLFGGSRTDPKEHCRYRIRLRSSNPIDKRNLEFEFLDQKVICGDVPRLPKGPLLKELKQHKVWLSDMGSDCPKIEMLIGSDIYGGILTGQVKQLEGGLTAVNTKLGWTVCGQHKEYQKEKGENISTLYLNSNLAIQNWNEINFKGHYLPHHPVFKDSVTTKIRPVFDASCKVNRAPSLNDCLFKGPNLIEEIPSILLRFREKSIGVTSDIRRAFLQIELKKEDRDFVRFLWWEKENSVKVFRHARVVFGVTSSPFLLGAVIAFHLSQVPSEQSSIAQKLEKSFHIDNCVTSVDNEQELVDFMKYSTEILAEAKMDLRLWTFGPVKDVDLVSRDASEEFALEDTVPVLGVMWDRKEDNLFIAIKSVPVSENLSKREVLSLTQTVFDPLGFLTPVLLPAKLLLQEIWATKVEWDAPLPENMKSKFLKWYNNLQILTDLKLPRRMGFGESSSWSLHVFCDASQHAYATVIFLRCVYNGEIRVSFVASKSRVAPLKRMTIPRLELMACVLGVRLSKYVTEALSLEDCSKYFWTDSTSALYWIKRNDVWGTFVGNRVREICAVSQVCQWSYVPGDANPADLPSRGCSPLQFSKFAWWEGPIWLKGSKDSWPSLEVKPDESLISTERKKVTSVNVNANSNVFRWYEKFSGYGKIVRVLAWVRRFIRNARKKSVSKAKFLSSVEVQESRIAVSLLIQKESFSQSGNSVNCLSIIRDQSGLIRVKTKILERDDDFDFKYPILLPTKHHIVECLIREYHCKNSHAGIQALMSIIREEFWIISARRSIRTVIRKCITCKRFTAKSPVTVPIHLPLDRVRDALPFEVTGVDLCGPLLLRDKTKTWVVLFTCAVYRAVHLETVTSISSEVFLQALRRFIARRGRPAVIYSDNGTNFTGVSAALKKIDWAKLIASEITCPIEWKFIPPTAAWWGGWWERLIRSTKNLLVRVLGRASVTYEELITILCDIESVLNNRPLTYTSTDAEDLIPLTPSHFLRDLQKNGTPDIDHLDRAKLLSRQRYCQELRQQLRSRFRKEYLGQLVQKAGRGSVDLKVGEVVIVGSENQKRLNWPLAVVQELYPGRDGHVRVVKVKTPHGSLVRPVQKLFPLEVSSSADPILLQENRQNSPGSIHKCEESAEGVPSTSNDSKHRTSPLSTKPPGLGVKKSETTRTVPVVPYTSRSGRLIKAPLRLNY